MSRNSGKDIRGPRIPSGTRRDHFPARVHQAAISDRGENEWNRKLVPENCRAQIGSWNGHSMARPEGDILKDAAVFAKRDFSLSSAIQIVKHGSGQSPARYWPKIFDANNPWRLHRAALAGCRGSGHQVQDAKIRIDSNTGKPYALSNRGGAREAEYRRNYFEIARTAMSEDFPGTEFSTVVVRSTWKYAGIVL
jgi:hypothetical protein